MDRCDNCDGYIPPLLDSDTAEEIGPATAEQISASLDAGREGHIMIDEEGEVVVQSQREHAERQLGATLRRVYVQRMETPCCCEGATDNAKALAEDA